MDWRNKAACRTEDPELFFPAGATCARQITEAKSVCHRCPVTADCLRWAMDTGQHYGIWGGLSEEERLVLLRCGARITGRAHLILISASEQYLIETSDQPKSGNAPTRTARTPSPGI